MTSEHMPLEIVHTSNLLPTRAVDAVLGPSGLQVLPTWQTVVVGGATREPPVAGAPSDSLLGAFDLIARRGEGPASWAAPLGGDPIAFLLDSMSDAANLWRADGTLCYRNRASLALGTIASAPADLGETASAIEAFYVQGQGFERRCMRCRMCATPYVLEVIRELARPEANDEATTGGAWPNISADAGSVAVSHELRGRRNVLTLNSDGLLCAARSSGTELSRASLLRRLERLDRALRSMRELMGRVLELQRRQLAAVSRPQVDLCAVVLEVLDSEHKALRSAGCAWTLVTPKAVTGHWDARLLRVAIGNLVNNALKFGAGRPIAINVGERDAAAFVRVADQGSGVRPEDYQSIFERTSGRARVNGWGPGLWLVRNIARAHGGDVTVRSAPGEGAAFTLSLPRQLTGTR